MADTRPLVYVVGDFILDRYIQGEATHICPDAPVPAVVQQDDWTRAGGSWNVARNVAAADVEVVSFAVDGDGPHRGLSDAVCEAAFNHDQSVVLTIPGRTTQLKTRILGQYGQQLLRLDVPKDKPISAPEAANLVQLMSAARTREPDVVLVADYGCGVVTPDLMEMVKATFPDAKVIVDPYPSTDPEVYMAGTISRVYAMTPNDMEYQTLLDAVDDDRDLANLSQFFLVTNRSDPVEVIETSPGLDYVEVRDYPVPERDLVDACGAGDSFVAHFAAWIARGYPPEEAVVPAIHAGACAVSRRGVEVVTAEMVAASMDVAVTD